MVVQFVAAAARGAQIAGRAKRANRARRAARAGGRTSGQRATTTQRVRRAARTYKYARNITSHEHKNDAELGVEIEKKHHRIGNFVAGLLIATAAAIDGLQTLLAITVILPPIIGFMASIMFYLWYKLLGVDFTDNLLMKGMALWGTAIVEAIPLLASMPAWTGGVLLMIAIVRIEDKIYNKTHTVA